jgi:multidrug efflux pump subunit AcrB
MWTKSCITGSFTPFRSPFDEGDYRTRAENVGQFFVRNNKNEMVPLSALTRFERRPGPEFTMRFNEYRAAQINGAAAAGYSAAQAMVALEEVFAQTMPREMGYDYMGMSFQEKKAQQGVPPSVVFGFSLLFVFLIAISLQLNDHTDRGVGGRQYHLKWQRDREFTCPFSNAAD